MNKDYSVIGIMMKNSDIQRVQAIAEEQGITAKEYLEGAIKMKITKDECSSYFGEDTVSNHINLWDIQTALLTLQEVCESFIHDGCEECPLYSEMNNACGCEHINQDINVMENKVHRFFD